MKKLFTLSVALCIWAFADAQQFSLPYDWVNPLPQGSDIVKFENLGSTNQVIGLTNIGTLIKNDGSEQSWQLIANPGNDVSVADIIFINENLGFAATNEALYKTTNGANSWQELGAMPGFSNTYGKFSFFSDQEGYLSEFSSLKFTDDQGQTWSSVALSGDNMNPNDIAFFNKDSGLMAIGGFSGGSIVKTTDAGQSFTSVLGPIDNVIFSKFDFPTHQVGYVIGSSTHIYKTTDGGDNWTNISAGIDTLFGMVQDLHFIDENNGSIIAHDVNNGNNVLYQTSDGGSTWNSTLIGEEKHRSFKTVFQALTITADGSAITAGNGGYIYTRTGVIPEFTPRHEGFEGLIMDLQPVEVGSIAAITDKSIIFLSSDNGKSWNEINVPNSASAFSQYWKSMDHGYVGYVDTNNDWKISKTTDGGSTFNEVHASGGPIFNIYFVNDQLGYALGDLNTLLETRDGGDSWTNISNHTNAFINYFDIDFPTENVGYISGDSGLIYKTTDAGLNWSLITEPDAIENYSALSFVDENYGFVLKNYGQEMLKTTDGGSTWQPIEVQNFFGQWSDIHFLNKDTGVAISRFSGTHVTLNGGTTWQKSTLPNLNLSAMEATADGTLWFSGMFSSIIKSDKFNKTVSTGISNESRETIGYPNPVVDRFYLSKELTGAEVRILDISGKAIFQGINQGEALDFSGFAPGTYLVKARLNGGELNQVVIKK